MSVKTFGPGLLGESSVAIGIDQSLTGFALTAVDIHNPEQYSTWVYKSPYRGVQRLDDIAAWLYTTLEDLDKWNVLNVAMEGTVLQSQAASILGELAGVTKLVLFQHYDTSLNPDCALPLQIPPMTLKKYAAGKGNAKKQEMLLQMYKRWGVEFNDDNAADSYGLARMAAYISIDAVETSIIDKIKDPKYRDSIL